MLAVTDKRKTPEHVARMNAGAAKKWIGTHHHLAQLREIQAKGAAAGNVAKRKRAVERRAAYDATPAVCRHCGEHLSYEQRDGSFCSIPCSAAGRRCRPKVARSKRTLKEFYAERMKSAAYEELGIHLKRRRLLAEQDHKCAACGNGPEWNGKPLTFQLDHRDGNKKNNNRANHCLLCPNCHTQTPTWGNKLRKSKEISPSP